MGVAVSSPQSPVTPVSVTYNVHISTSSPAVVVKPTSSLPFDQKGWEDHGRSANDHVLEVGDRPLTVTYNVYVKDRDSPSKDLLKPATPTVPPKTLRLRVDVKDDLLAEMVVAASGIWHPLVPTKVIWRRWRSAADGNLYITCWLLGQPAPTPEGAVASKATEPGDTVVCSALLPDVALRELLTTPVRTAQKVVREVEGSSTSRINILPQVAVSQTNVYIHDPNDRSLRWASAKVPSPDFFTDSTAA
jgi:hypothetical protein